MTPNGQSDPSLDKAAIRELNLNGKRRPLPNQYMIPNQFLTLWGIGFDLIQGWQRRIAMPASVPLRRDFDARHLRKLASRCKDARQSRRLLSLAAVLA